MSSLGDDFDRMDFEYGTFDEQVTDEEIDSYNWKIVKSKSDAKFIEDYGLVQEVASVFGDNTILPIDCYHHFIMDEMIDRMVRETNRYAEQELETYEIGKRSESHQWKLGFE